MPARVLLDRINFITDKILKLSIEYMSLLPLISDVMKSFFHEPLETRRCFNDSCQI